MRKLTIEEMNRISVEEFHKCSKLPLVIVLDNVRSVYNIGSVFRTADAFRIEEIVLCGICACPPSAEIHKTALGAEDAVKWTYCKDTLEAVKGLRNRDYQIIAVEQVEGSILLNQWIPDRKKKYALILGNEVKGVRQDVVDLCDHCLEIPQYGTKHSLNVSCTASIVMWDFFKSFQNFTELS